MRMLKKYFAPIGYKLCHVGSNNRMTQLYSSKVQMAWMIARKFEYQQKIKIHLK